MEAGRRAYGRSAAAYRYCGASAKKLLLSNVWCAHCGHAVTITNFTGSVKGGDLVLKGQCSECRGDVARLIEMG